jgi:hypothetical protein
LERIGSGISAKGLNHRAMQPVMLFLSFKVHPAIRVYHAA